MTTHEPPANGTPSASHCPVCGRELPRYVAPSRCPQCLLRAGMADPTAPAAATVLVPGLEPSSAPRREGGWPQPGQAFGHYRILRLLGAGGMGAVFEAEDVEAGRRVALKVLGHRLDSPEARGRFFREGRLAASINHPNSVYVFGTEEIAGIPVIAMELVPGGTLQSRVADSGPLGPAETVAAALQIMVGLEAAQRVGVLHRDIKPSNCFIDDEGTVKIGDFGLSISLATRLEPTLTAPGAFLGTPAYASPEQLRGEEMSVRSDIYSLGVTLYYLLTGRHPFEAPDLVRMLATVLERRAESPALWRRELPAGLCRVVLRCLEKDPERRFRNYPELRAALQPYAPGAPTPATLGLRALAGALDSILLSIPQQVLVLWVLGGMDAWSDPATYRNPKALLLGLGNLAWLVMAYGMLEGIWGATAGKAICRLRVVRPGGSVPGVPRALVRALVFLGPPNVPWLLALGWSARTDRALFSAAGLLAINAVVMSLMALIFSTARRRNGFAGWHDLASGTRVVARPSRSVRPELPVVEDPPPATEVRPVVGAYHLLRPLAGSGESPVWIGFDPRLLRRVWVRQLPLGAPMVPAALRRVGRPGRLRWLHGRRTETEAWDVYEGLSGRSLRSLIAERPGWEQVRYWLLDLAEELHRALQDGSLPGPLALDRVWITGDGRAKLLDFPVAGDERPDPANADPDPVSERDARRFLRQVAMAALQGVEAGPGQVDRGVPGVPLARHAAQLMEELASDLALAEVPGRLRAVLGRPAIVSRARRVTLLAGTLAFPLLAAAMGFATFGLMTSFLQTAPEIAALRVCVFRHQALQHLVRAGHTNQVADRDAVEQFIAGQYGAVLTNATRWTSLASRIALPEPMRREAERLLERHPSVAPESLAAARASVERQLGQPIDAAARAGWEQPGLPTLLFITAYGNSLVFVVLPCLLASLAFRGGALVHALGMVWTTRHGARASRLRVTGRNLVAWAPFLMLPVLIAALSGPLGRNGATGTAVGVVALLTLVSALLPGRGLADRFTGVWPVPR